MSINSKFKHISFQHTLTVRFKAFYDPKSMSYFEQRDIQDIIAYCEIMSYPALDTCFGFSVELIFFVVDQYIYESLCFVVYGTST